MRWAVIQALAKRHYNINTTNDQGNTLLHEIASKNIAFQKIRSMKEKMRPFYLHEKINDGEWLESVFEVYEHVFTEIVSALIEHGADRSIRNNDGKTAFDLYEEANWDEYSSDHPSFISKAADIFGLANRKLSCKE